MEIYRALAIDPKEARRRRAARKRARLLQLLLDDLARAGLSCADLRVLEEVALALGVGARDALPALELAQLFLGTGAVLLRLAAASCSSFAAFSLSFCASSWRLR